MEMSRQTFITNIGLRLNRKSAINQFPVACESLKVLVAELKPHCFMTETDVALLLKIEAELLAMPAEAVSDKAPTVPAAAVSKAEEAADDNGTLQDVEALSEVKTTKMATVDVKKFVLAIK